MGDRLQSDKPLRYATSHQAQLSLAMPQWIGTNKGHPTVDRHKEYKLALGCKQAHHAMH